MIPSSCENVTVTGRHLSGALNALPYAEIYHDPGEEQAKGQVPLDGAWLADAFREMQYFAPAENS